MKRYPVLTLLLTISLGLTVCVSASADARLVDSSSLQGEIADVNFTVQPSRSASARPAAAAQVRTAWCSDVTADTTWTAANGPYVVTCDVTILPGATLTVELDTEVEFFLSTGLRVEGRLAPGTAGHGTPPLFKANSTIWDGIDVAPGGTVWGSLAVENARVGLSFCAESDGSLDYAQFTANVTGLRSFTKELHVDQLHLYDNSIGLDVHSVLGWDPAALLLARGNEYAVRVRNSSVHLGASAMIEANGYGVFLENDVGSGIQAQFRDNTWAVYNASGESCVDASNSQWGDKDGSGPYDSSNAEDRCGQGTNYGNGDAVSDNVLYTPWRWGFCRTPGDRIGCGESLTGSNTDSTSTDRIDYYPCIDWNESGHEHSYHFKPKVSGEVNVTVHNISTDLHVFVLQAGDDWCNAEDCIACGDASVSFDATAEQDYYLVVDGFQGAYGNYTIEVDCESETANLSGTVFDATNRWPLPGVSVSISGPFQANTLTDIRGEYSFHDVPAGEYWLGAVRDGFEEHNTLISIFDDGSYSFPINPARSYADLAAHYAPVWHQDTQRLDFDADYVTRFDFDENWVGNDNWLNQNGGFPLDAYVYYAAVETASHWFITYAVFHPRDWGESGPPWCVSDDGVNSVNPSCHENDMEGVVVVVKKPTKSGGKPYGQFQLMETVWRSELHQYSNDVNITPGTDEIDGGVLFFQDSHPILYVEPGGHGVKAYHGQDFLDGDGVIYVYEEGNAGTPPPENPFPAPTVTYDLIPIKETLWKHRSDFLADDGDGARTFASWGTFDGDDFGTASANAPWGWDDGYDGPVYQGDIFRSPAYAVDTHLNGLGLFSHEYVYNPYWSSEAVFLAESGGVLISRDGRTQVAAPAGAAPDPILMSQTPRSDLVPTAGLAYIGQAFELSAADLASGSPVSHLDEALEITVEYGDAIQRFAEESVGLYWWSGSRWILEPSSSVDETENALTATVNRVATYAVFGAYGHSIMLPLVVRNR